MTDLRLTVSGENNAGRALSDAAGGVQDISGAVADGITQFNLWNKALSVTTQFLKESYKASEEQAKADRQLAKFAGESTNAFKAQASALQASLGVSDDMIERMQTMLLRFGESKDEVNKTVKALLDYSAASGTDAVQATEQLLSSAKTGRAAFKELNLSVDNTHGSLTTLRSTTDALAQRLGGSAEAEASTLGGSVRRAREAFGELQETVGDFMRDIVVKSGALDFVTEKMNALNASFHPELKTAGGNAFGSRAALKEELDAVTKRTDAYAKMSAAEKQAARDAIDRANEASHSSGVLGTGFLGSDANPFATIEKQILRKKELETLLNKVTLEAGDPVFGPKGDPEKEAAAAKKAAELRKRIEADRLRNAEDAHEYEMSLNEKFAENIRRANDQYQKEEEEEFKKNQKTHLDEFTKSKEEEMKMMVKSLSEEADLAAKEQARWAHAGEQIGAAFANSLGNAIEQLGAGGEVDVGETVGDILAAILTVAGGVIGTAIGPGGTAVGAAIGGLAGSAVHAATRKKRTRHNGGWAGDFPSYHDGAWVGSNEELAKLEHGERVLSQPEVAAMGGNKAVDAAARGGGGIGGMTVNISTFDGSTAKQYFEQQGGRALQNALRTGRGVLPGVFGGR